MAELICPSCGTANPSNFINCRVCKSLLYGFAQPSQAQTRESVQLPPQQNSVLRSSRSQQNNTPSGSNQPQRTVRQSRQQARRNAQAYGDLVLEEDLGDWIPMGSQPTPTATPTPPPPPPLEITVEAPASLANNPVTLAQQAGLGEGWEVVTDPAEQAAAGNQTIDFQPTWEPAPVVGAESTDVPPIADQEPVPPAAVEIVEPVSEPPPAQTSSRPVNSPRPQLVPWRESEQPDVVAVDPCNEPGPNDQIIVRTELPEQPIQLAPFSFTAPRETEQLFSKPQSDIRTSVIDPATWFKSNYKNASASQLRLTDQQREYAMVLESVILDERRVQPIEAVQIPPASKWLQWIVAFLVIGAICFGLIAKPQYMRLPALYAPENVNFFRAIEKVQHAEANAKVFIAMDFEAKSFSELKTVINPVTHQLMVGNPAIAMVATSPTASILGVEMLTDTLQKPGNTLVSRRLHNLGFLPGGASGLAAIANDIKAALPLTLQGKEAWTYGQFMHVENINSFDAIILVTDRSEEARMWMEQVQPALQDTPFLVVSTTQAGPMLQPYVQSGQINGAIFGINGAASFTQIAKTDNSELRKFWDVYQIGILGIAVILIIGLVATFTIRVNRRYRDEGEIW
ncbi:MAG TPA: hypothetical protein PKD55_02060 [Bellilinea sp.]|nr:hypothetical protein [Bellilinea sp.]